MALGNDIGFVVQELNIKYIQPLRAADEVIVETRMTDVGAAVVKIAQKFVKDNSECAIINLKVAYLGADMRPKRIPQDFIAGLV